MRYFLAILLPPLAVLSCRRPLAALLNCFFTLLWYFPGVIHAILTVNRYYADQRHEAEMRLIHQTHPRRRRGSRGPVRGPSLLRPKTNPLAGSVQGMS